MIRSSQTIDPALSIENATILAGGWAPNLHADIIAASGVTAAELASDASKLAVAIEKARFERPEAFLPASVQRDVNRLSDPKRRALAAAKAVAKQRDKATSTRRAHERVMGRLSTAGDKT